jgi:signal transduction histidine kinase
VSGVSGSTIPNAAARPTWERFGDAMLEWGGYVLLAIATFIAVSAGTSNGADQGWVATTLAIAVGAALWIFVMYTRSPLPRTEHRLRLDVFFVGLLVIASILMIRQPLFFIFMIAGFFYATALRPMVLAVLGVVASSILVNTLIAGFPQNAESWTFYLSIIGIQSVVISAGAVLGEKVSEQSEERRQALARLEEALEENAGLHAQLLTQAREAGVLDERGRMAREIHDTIAQGLTGIITQLEAADAAHDRPDDRDRHLGNAKRLARESLAEARRSVEAGMPAALESRTLPDALREVAGEWSELNGIPADVTITGDAIALHPDIEVALLRTGQEALANVAKHAGATRAALTLSYMGDVVTLDIRDDGVGFAVADRGPADPSGSGFGLTAMRQRVARVAGSLAIESEPGGGTAVSARVPAVATGPAATSHP